MNSINESLIEAFYSHKLHVEERCDLQCPSEKILGLSKDIISQLIEMDCQKIIQIIRKTGIYFDISPRDVPQFSNLDDCVYKVPFLIRDCNLEDVTFLQMGYMLRTKPRKEVADMKYGENQSKTAAQMGLCSIVNARIYTSYLGVTFCKLDKEVQMKLVPKLILFMPYIFNQFATYAKYKDIIASVSFLSKSTQNRRLTNIWYLLTQINKVLPYEFQIIRY